MMLRDELAKKSEPTLEWFTPLRVAFVLVALLFGAFPKVMAGLETFFYRDYGVLAYPCAYFQRECFWKGEWPLWNPLSNCGVPFAAQWGTAWYPFSLVYLVFPLPWSLSYFCFAHLLLGGMGMYMLARRWTGDGWAGCLAGVAFIFNGVTFSCLLWPNYTVALGWMPWLVWWIERSWREGGRPVVVSGVVAALQLLSGVPELVVLTWLFVGTLAIRELVRGEVVRMALIRRLLTVVVIAAGLAAVQLLPFFDLLTHSQRDSGFATQEKWAMPGWGWANLLVPLFHCFETYQGPFFQYGQEFLSSYYPGAAFFVMALWAAWRVREGRVWVLTAWLVAVLVLALGEIGVVFGWLKGFLPLLGIARYPVKFVLLLVLVLPLLVAFAVKRISSDRATRGGVVRELTIFGVTALVLMGMILWFARMFPFPLDQWEVTWRNAAGRAFFMAAILALVMWLARETDRRHKLAGQLAMLGLILADVSTHTVRQNPSFDTRLLAPGLWATQNGAPPPQLGAGRVYITPEAERGVLGSTVRDNQSDFLGRRLALWSNLNLLDGAPKVNGAATLQLREQKQVEQLIYGATNRAHAGLLDFLSAAKVTAPGNPTEWLDRTNYLTVVSAGQKPIFETAAKTLDALAASDFDPRAVVYLPSEARDFVSVSNGTRVRILPPRFTAQVVEFDTEAPAPALVVVAQTFYHPWKATIDGRPATLLRANHAFQAVEVPAGRHRVTLVYRDRKLLWGMAISAGTMVVCLVALRRFRTKTAVAG